MSELSAPDDPEDLWLASTQEDVPPARMLMQGDIIVVDSDTVCVVSHACSMRRGSQLHPTQIVAPVRNQPNTAWHGNYDWMPLPNLQHTELRAPAANLRELLSASTADLQSGQRIGVMADTGIHLLQQRMAHHLTRVIIGITELAEHSAPILAEVDLHEEWTTELGESAEPAFSRFSGPRWPQAQSLARRAAHPKPSNLGNTKRDACPTTWTVFMASGSSPAKPAI